MEGGIGILLILIVLVVAGVIGLVLYLTGGSLWAGRMSGSSDTVAGESPEPVEQRHIRPESVVGDDDPAKRSAREAERAAQARRRRHGHGTV
jgi:hypothetical protein